MTPSVLLTGFTATRPRYELPQERFLAWLIEAHARAQAALEGLDEVARECFAQRIGRVLRRCACGPDKIGSRSVALRDLGSESWDDNALYPVSQEPHGKGAAVRGALFSELVTEYFETTYAEHATAPEDLIHVTCTGYVSPSGAQRLVAKRGWGATTRVTHAYHMGCYAAVPAIRIAAGFLATSSRRVDIAHTELCSLHFDATDHRIEQLVVQSLFADGMIRYSLRADEDAPGLRLRALHECVVPDSADAMSWMASDFGMRMTLAREVPDRIASSLRAFVLDLYKRAGLGLRHLRDSVFAVHPGGPRIIDRVREVLELDEAQVRTSRAVLFDRGNMSSATLPHIWMRLVDDREVAPGTLIPSLAFGPGLTVCGALFEKQ